MTKALPSLPRIGTARGNDTGVIAAFPGYCHRFSSLHFEWAWSCHNGSHGVGECPLFEINILSIWRSTLESARMICSSFDLSPSFYIGIVVSRPTHRQHHQAAFHIRIPFGQHLILSIAFCPVLHEGPSKNRPRQVSRGYSLSRRKNYSSDRITVLTEKQNQSSDSSPSAVSAIGQRMILFSAFC